MVRPKVSIPSPCPVKWESMNSVADWSGKHCSSCNKLVTDFTSMSTAEMQEFFKNYQGQKTCGRFRTPDTDTKINWYQSTLLNVHNYIENNFRKNTFRSAALLAMGSMITLAGCGPTMGEIQFSPEQAKKDSIAYMEQLKQARALQRNDSIAADSVVKFTARFPESIKKDSAAHLPE
jgi:hypothetical protein